MWVAAISQLLWLNFAPITSLVQELFHVAEFDVGLLSLVFPLLFIPISVPAGVLTDTKGFKLAVSVGGFVMAIFGTLRVFSIDFTTLLVFQSAVAVGQPFVLNSLTKLVAAWFPYQERVLATGLGSMALFIGMMISLSLTPILTLSVGLAAMLATYAFFSIMGAVFFLIVAREKPTQTREVGAEQAFSLKALRTMLTSKDLILLDSAFFIGVGLFTGLATWLQKILEPYGISIVQAGAIGGALIVGGIVGSIVVPALSDRLARRKPFLVMDLVVSALGIAGLTFGGGYLRLAGLAFVLGFFLMSALPVGLEVGAELVGPALAGSSAAVLWLFSQIGSVAFIVAIESVKTVTGTFYYSMLLLVALDLLAAGMCLGIRETGMKRDD